MSSPTESVMLDELRSIGIKLDAKSPDFLSVLSRLLTSCATLSLTPQAFCEKFDSFLYKNSLSVKSSLRIDLISQFESDVLADLKREAQRAAERKAKGTQRTSNIKISNVSTMGMGMNIQRAPIIPPSSQSSSPPLEVKNQRENPQGNPKKSQQNTQNTQNSQNSPNSLIQSDDDFLTPLAPIRRQGLLNVASESFEESLNSSIVSSVGNYQSRVDSGQIVTSWNAELAAPYLPSAGEDSMGAESIAPRRLIDLSVLFSSEELDEMEAKKNFRYMFIDDDDQRDLLATRQEEVVEALIDSEGFKELAKRIIEGRVSGVIKKKQWKTEDDDAEKTVVKAEPKENVKMEDSEDNTETTENNEKDKENTENNPNGTTSPKTEGEKSEMVVDESESIDVSLSPVTHRSPESILVSGRVVINEDSDTKLTSQSIQLEGDRNLSDGRRVKLNIGNLKAFSFFPGQIIVAKGINLNGTSFVVDDGGVLSDASLPHFGNKFSSVQKFNDAMQNSPMNIMVAAGPFTTQEDLNYSPLVDLLKEVRKSQPDLLILMGPFVDCEHPRIDSVRETFYDLFANIVYDVLDKLNSIRTRLVLVPHPRDAHHIPIYPQPQFNMGNEFRQQREAGKLLLTSNPATLKINDFIMGINNVDVLAAFPELAPLSHPSPLPRLARLSQHCIHQQSYYPVFPFHVPEGTKSPSVVDSSHMARYTMSVTPDILITPSKLKHFVADIGHECIGINPEFLTKGKGAGTYARIAVHPLSESELLLLPKIKERCYQHEIVKRTRVDIIKI